MAADPAEKRGKDLETAKAAVPVSVQLGPDTTLDLSFLPEEERRNLLTEHVRGMLDISRKSAKLDVDVDALRETLEVMSGAVKKAAQHGIAVTISDTQESTLGRTEIIMGNTAQARSGKLPQKQT